MATANGRFEGVLVRGMRVEDIRANKTITGNVRRRRHASRSRPGSGKVAIGSRLADTLGAYPGSQITLWNPEGRSTVVGTVPREVTYTVGAIFEIGVYDYDKAFVLHADAGRAGAAADGRPGRHGRDPDHQSRQGAADHRAASAGWSRAEASIVDWRQMNSALFQALEVERVAMFVVLSLIVLVAVFNILSSLIMLVRAKTRDIAILRTMGASRRGMMKVFMTVGVTIGSLGIVLGLILGAIFLYLPPGRGERDPGRHRPEPVGSVGPLPDRPSGARPIPFEVAAIILIALVLSFLATLYPGLQGGEHRSGPGAAL